MGTWSQYSGSNWDENSDLSDVDWNSLSLQRGGRLAKDSSGNTYIKNDDGSVRLAQFHDHPSGLDNFVSAVAPVALAAAGIYVGGAGLGLFDGAGLAGSAALDSVGTDIAGSLASGDLALGSGIEAGVGADAAGTVGTGIAEAGTEAAGGLTTAQSELGNTITPEAAPTGGLTAAQQASIDSVGTDINSSLASGNLGADSTVNGVADYTSTGGTGVSASQGKSAFQTLKDAYSTAKNINSGLGIAKTLFGSNQSSAPSGPVVPGQANTSTIGGLSQSVTPATIAAPTYHDWQSYIAPGN
jgi:hypothetical protein